MTTMTTTNEAPNAFAMHMVIMWGPTVTLDARASCVMTRDILLGLCDNYASDTKAHAVLTLPDLGELLGMLTGSFKRYQIGDDTGIMTIELTAL